jgi:methionyl-tRNA formyltransferase
MAAVQAPRRLAHTLAGMVISKSSPFQSFLGRPISSFTSLLTTPIKNPSRSRQHIRTYSRAVTTQAASINSATANDATSAGGKKKIVFLGTPEVAALVLQKLIDASKIPDSTYEISAIVSQPGRPKGRSRQPQPSAVEKLALDLGLTTDQILCPEKATDPSFLDTLTNLQPDLCITAAYGNYLPSKFLSIPRYGTLNIHPSLLPAYRGAAPVQRSLEDGLTISGVTVLYTVKEMDAGPILAQQKMPIDAEVQAPELLDRLFTLGTELLLTNLEVVWAGMGDKMAQPQDSSAATHAPKLTREQGKLDFCQPATVCHNKVRAFAPWPGTYHTFELVDTSSPEKTEELELKVLKTRVLGEEGNGEPSGASSEKVVAAGPAGLTITCGDGQVLELLEVQAPGRKAVAAKDFVNGLKGRVMKWK